MHEVHISAQSGRYVHFCSNLGLAGLGPVHRVQVRYVRRAHISDINVRYVHSCSNPALGQAPLRLEAEVGL